MRDGSEILHLCRMALIRLVRLTDMKGSISWDRLLGKRLFKVPCSRFNDFGFHSFALRPLTSHGPRSIAMN